MDFQELRSELLEEYYFWADRPSGVFLNFQPSYWRIRGSAYVAATANLSGTKYMVTAQTPDGLVDRVKQALMFADHVIVRHEWYVPHQGHLFVPTQMALPGGRELDWVAKHKGVVEGVPVLPHIPGCPNPETTRSFLDWMCGDGREWVQRGLVTYLPCVIPRQASIQLLSEDVNVASACRQHDVLPDDGRVLDSRGAAAIAQLRLPYLEGVSPEVLADLRSENSDAVVRFRRHVLNLLDMDDVDPGTEAFARRVDQVSEEIADATATLEGQLSTYARTASWQRIGVEVLSMTAGILFLVGAPEAAIVGSLGAAAATGAKAMKDQIQARHDLKTDPYYALTRLGEKRRLVSDWRPKLLTQAGAREESNESEDPPEEVRRAVEGPHIPGFWCVKDPEFDAIVWILTNQGSFEPK